MDGCLNIWGFLYFWSIAEQLHRITITMGTQVFDGFCGCGQDPMEEFVTYIEATCRT